MTTLIGSSSGMERNGDLVFFSLNGEPFAISAAHAILLGGQMVDAGTTVDEATPVSCGHTVRGACASCVEVALPDLRQSTSEVDQLRQVRLCVSFLVPYDWPEPSLGVRNALLLWGAEDLVVATPDGQPAPCMRQDDGGAPDA